MERVRGDLADVDLARVGTLKGRTCVGVAKHLCGSATDLALNAFVGLSDARGVAVATCCHHRCEWSRTWAATTSARRSAAPRPTSRGSRGGRRGRARSRTARRESTRRRSAPTTCATIHQNRSARSAGAARLCWMRGASIFCGATASRGRGPRTATSSCRRRTGSSWPSGAFRAPTRCFRWCASRRAARCCPGSLRRGSVVVWSSLQHA